MRKSASYIIRLILVLWALWFTIAFLTNFFDVMRIAGFVDPQWKFASGNYEQVQHVVSIYGLQNASAGFFFAGDLFLLLINAILFWWSVVIFDADDPNAGAEIIEMAFFFNMGIWALFIIFEEVFIAYNFESTHKQLLIMALLSFIIVKMLPNRAYEARE